MKGIAFKGLEKDSYQRISCTGFRREREVNIMIERELPRDQKGTERESIKGRQRKHKTLLSSGTWVYKEDV